MAIEFKSSISDLRFTRTESSSYAKVVLISLGISPVFNVLCDERSIKMIIGTNIKYRLEDMIL